MNTSNGIRCVASANGAVLVDIQRGGTFALNLIGSRIWQLVQEGKEIEQIVDQIGTDFKAPREVVASDVEEFLAALRKQDLITE